MGDRYANSQVRIESIAELRTLKPRYTFVGFGFGNAFDAEVTLLSNIPGHREEGLLDLSYNYIPAIPDFGLGISVGVQDIADRSEAGRSFYFAITQKTNNFDVGNADTPTEITLGLGTGRYGGMFFGARLPITNVFRIVTEYDSHRPMVGLEIVPTENLTVRWLIRDRETLLGFSLSKRF